LNKEGNQVAVQVEIAKQPWFMPPATMSKQ
jgi:hypothetical protein